MSRIFNFSAGPAVLPLEVLEEAQRELVDCQKSGMSIMEMSHRGKVYDAVHQEAQANLRELLKLPEDFEVLLLQGGASMQFATIPMNFLGQGQTADYVNSGAWGAAAIKQARLLGNVNVCADCEKDLPTRVPLQSELKLTPGAAYFHYTTNETISGAQWKTLPKVEAPMIADMSSDILSRPIDMAPFSLAYAGAQKNLGPSGVTVVLIRKSFAERSNKAIPAIFRYPTHIEAQSLYNTPPCFGIYILMHVTRWVKRTGLERLWKQNADKAALLYTAIDASDFYRGTASEECRSDMNVTFRLPTAELEAEFCSAAKKEGLDGLKGHRSVGGVRASIYNAFPVEGVTTLVQFMREFERVHG